MNFNTQRNGSIDIFWKNYGREMFVISVRIYFVTNFIQLPVGNLRESEPISVQVLPHYAIFCDWLL